MSTPELLEQLKYLSNPERLAVIETATRLLREDLTAQAAAVRVEQDRRMQQAALAVKDLYEPGGELAEWTTLDAEDILDSSER
jgi:hypothetical protein